MPHNLIGISNGRLPTHKMPITTMKMVNMDNGIEPRIKLYTIEGVISYSISIALLGINIMRFDPFLFVVTLVFGGLGIYLEREKRIANK